VATGSIRACYEAGLRRDRGLTGRISVDLGIEAGAVTWVEVAEDSVGDAEVTRCVVSAVEAMRLVPSVTDQAYLPFVFSAQ
jgi:hypothetical protein